MPDRHPCGDEALKRRLQCEAGATRPAFSPSLDERLRQSVRRSRATAASWRPSTAVESLPVWLTAAILLGALTFGILGEPARFRPRDGSPRVGSAQSGTATISPSVPRFSELDELAGFTDGAVSRWDLLVDSTMSRRRWAYLDEDARSALSMLADRLPVDVRFLTGSSDLIDDSRADLAGTE